jgi:hypothetical protein
VEQWAEIRRMHFVERFSIKEIGRRTGRDRKTIRRALRSAEPPCYRRPPRPSKLDPFREEIERLLRCDPRPPGKRIRELIEELGYRGSKTILDDYLRELRPRYLVRRTYQQLRARAHVLLGARLPGPARRVDRAGQRAQPPHDPRRPRRAARRRAAADAPAAGADAGDRSPFRRPSLARMVRMVRSA